MTININMIILVVVFILLFKIDKIEQQQRSLESFDTFPGKFKIKYPDFVTSGHTIY